MTDSINVACGAVPLVPLVKHSRITRSSSGKIPIQTTTPPSACLHTRTGILPPRFIPRRPAHPRIILLHESDIRRRRHPIKRDPRSPHIVPLRIPHDLHHGTVFIPHALLARRAHFRLVLHDGVDVVRGLEVVRDCSSVFPYVRDEEVVGGDAGVGGALVDVVADEVAGLLSGDPYLSVLRKELSVAHHLFAAPFDVEVSFAFELLVS